MSNNFGEFICSSCGAITYKEFPNMTEEQVVEEIINNGVKCLGCGREKLQIAIPSRLRAVCKALVNKGYKIFQVNGKVLSIVIVGRFQIDDPETLPYEFVLDSTEKIGDIIINGRLQADDFEGIDKEEYIKQASINLMNWVRTLPTIGHGKYLSYNDVNDGNDKK